MTDLNYHTEDEARQLWCWRAQKGATNRDGTTGFFECVASACMSWRWRDEGRTHGYCAADGHPQLIDAVEHIATANKGVWE